MFEAGRPIATIDSCSVSKAGVTKVRPSTMSEMKSDSPVVMSFANV